MPALKLFGRKWLAASDDLVFPCIFEVIWRTIFSIFTSLTLYRYWIFLSDVEINDDINNLDRNFTNESNESNDSMLFCHRNDVYFIKTYLIGVNAILALNIPLLVTMISYSARGSICDIRARQIVTPLLYFKIFLILPEIGFNVMGTAWAFCDVIECVNKPDNFANTSVEAFVIFNWIALSLVIFAMIIAFDPLGARKYRVVKDANGNLNDLNAHHEFMHKKVSKLWLRRFRLAFCCLTKDEYGDEAFSQTAELFSNLFNGTDLVPTDIIAGSVLMRVRQKKENREYQRNLLSTDNGCPRYSSDLSRVFNTQCASWMTLKNAQHFLRFALSSYGWPLPCAVAPCRSCCGIIRKVTCCASLRNKSDNIVDDNCCNCNEAGARYSSRVHAEDIIYASFKNQVFEVPFCLIADHKTKSVVLSIRGSWSISDIFTDLAARPGEFRAPGFPDNTYAHYGMIMCANQILKNLEFDNLLDRVLGSLPEYQLVITGHSLGAGLAVLVGAKLRAKYTDLRVFGFSTPNGLLTREAAKAVEQFVFTIVIGDDCFARLSLEAVESLKIGVLETLQSCRLPKYRVVLNSFSYAILGIPSADLESTWHDVTEISTQSNHSSTLLDPQIVATITNNAALMSGNTPRPKLCIAGKILHIVRKKNLDKKSMPTTYEMRWATLEDFIEIKVMPRMLFDHFPQNIMGALSKILKEQKRDSILSVDQI